MRKKNESTKASKWALAALAVIGSVSIARAADELSVESVLRRMAESYSALESMGAELEQAKSYPQLGLDDPAETGVLYIKRKGEGAFSIRLEMRVPEQRIVTVNDGRYVLYQPKIKQAIEGRVDQESGGHAGTSFINYFLGDLSTAMKDYEIVSLGDEDVGARRTVHLRLTAKPDGNGYYPRIDLWIDKELWVPVQQEFIEPNRSVTKVRFDAIRINEGLDDELFTIKIPKGVERVKG